MQILIRNKLLNLKQFKNVHGYEHLYNILFEEPNNKLELIGKFKYYNEKLDTVRDTSLQSANPELWELMYETD